ncbi:MAG: Gfo/Idh/MocA family oxidoreductase [Anaerolineae bacterium]|nr:Gfo/Idh/MocA family oxidoreductase [Anaerolineae bacterium]
MNQNIAVVGCGYWGKNLVRNFYQLQALHTICDTDEARIKAQLAQYPGLNAASQFEAVLDNRDIRGIVIATPAAMHYAQAKAAILKGKDVFVEKPLALHYEEGQELVALATANNVVLMVGHVLEYHPAVTLLKQLVKREELGRVWYIYSNRLNLGKVRQEENILWSFAPHDISVICSLLEAEPEVVSATGGSYLQQGIVDVTVTDLGFANGAKAHIFVSWLHPYKEQKLVVIGDKKMAVFDDTVREGKLKLYDKGIEWQAGLPVPRQASETTLYLEEQEPLRLECQHFLRCVAERTPPLTDGTSALRVLKVLQAGQMSLEQNGATIFLDRVATPATAQ